MTRLLFLTESFHPVLGGGEAHIRSLSRRLVAAGMPCLVVTRRSETALLREESLDGVRVRRVAPAGPARTGKYKMVPAALAALIAERDRYDVLVVRGTRILGLPGLIAARALGKRVVLQAELNGEMSGEVYSFGRLQAGSRAARLLAAGVALRNRLLLDADAYVAMSRQIAAEFEAAGVPRERIALIPHGVDTERFRPAAPGEPAVLRARLGLPADAVIVTYTGRLLEGKGLDTLLDAFRDARARRPDLYLLCVGSGSGQALSIEERLQARVATEGLAAAVRLTGRRDDVAEILRASDVFAFPSVFEALGLSLVEAAATGLACVGTRTGGIVDVIEDGRSGLLVAPGDAAGLTQALLRLAAEPALRAALGRAARAGAAARFDEAVHARSYAALFRELQRRSWPRRAA